MPATSSTTAFPSSSAAFVAAFFRDWPRPTRRRVPAASVYSIVQEPEPRRLKMDAMSDPQEKNHVEHDDESDQDEEQRRDEARAARDRPEDDAGEAATHD